MQCQVRLVVTALGASRVTAESAHGECAIKTAAWHLLCTESRLETAPSVYSLWLCKCLAGMHCSCSGFWCQGRRGPSLPPRNLPGHTAGHPTTRCRSLSAEVLHGQGCWKGCKPTSTVASTAPCLPRKSRPSPSTSCFAKGSPSSAPPRSISPCSPSASERLDSRPRVRDKLAETQSPHVVTIPDATPHTCPSPALASDVGDAEAFCGSAGAEASMLDCSSRS